MHPKFASEKEEREYYSSPADSIYRTRQGNRLVRAEALLHEGKLPSDFKHWDIKTSQGLTIAHAAAHHGKLPEGFDQWGLRANKTKWERETVAHVAARNGSLPDSFNGWGLEDDLHITVFERALDSNKKPKNSDQIFYDLTSKDSQFPFRVAGKLPESFDDWTLKAGWSQQGRTIAHAAAGLNKLPPNFHDWMIAEFDGNTVAHELMSSGFLKRGIPESFDLTYDQWMTQRDDGATVIGLAREKQAGEIRAQLEAAFMAASMNQKAPLSLSPHEAASRGALPEDFKSWGDKDENGVTVLQNHLEHLSKEGKPFDSKLADLATYLPYIEAAEGARGKMQAVEMAKLAHQFPETLPDNFELWNQRDRNGDTVAHAAVKKADQGGRVVLPSSTEDWGLKDGKGNSVVDVMRATKSPAVRAMLEDAYSKARPGQLGSLVIQGGQAQPQAVQPQPQAAQPQAQPSMSYIEAAQALKAGTLPADFNDWGKKNSDGWTIAHAAAALGKLPPDFKDWSMEGAKPGITVAHIAMRYSELPPSFNDWGLKDASGKTLGEVAVKHPKLGAEYQARIEASKQAQQPNIEVRAPEPQAAKPSSEAQAQGGKSNQAAPIETSSTGRITGGGRFNRPPDLSNREPEPERRPIKAFISRGM